MGFSLIFTRLVVVVVIPLFSMQNQYLLEFSNIDMFLTASINIKFSTKKNIKNPMISYILFKTVSLVQVFGNAVETGVSKVRFLTFQLTVLFLLTICLHNLICLFKYFLYCDVIVLCFHRFGHSKLGKVVFLLNHPKVSQDL